jgi:hypothetical protein
LAALPIVARSVAWRLGFRIERHRFDDHRLQPVVNAAVLVFPDDRRVWLPQSRRIHLAAIGFDGRYAVRAARG